MTDKKPLRKPGDTQAQKVRDRFGDLHEIKVKVVGTPDQPVKVPRPAEK